MLFHRFQDTKTQLLEKYKWGYFINIDDEEIMLIPAKDLFVSPVNILKAQNCQICKKRKIIVRLKKVLENSSHKEWNNKSFFCKPCAKKVQTELLSMTREEGDIFENPHNVNILNFRWSKNFIQRCHTFLKC